MRAVLIIIVAICLTMAASLVDAVGHTCTTTGLFCDSCNDMKVCVNADALDVVTCSELTKNTATFCDGNQCVVRSADPQCGPPQMKYTAEGVYPDTTDCTKFVIYEKMAGTTPPKYEASSDSCDRGMYFNVATNNCTSLAPPGAVTACLNFKCGTVRKNFIEYPIKSKYYAYCKEVANQNVQMTMFTCDQNHVFDLKSISCMFVCPQEGKFAVPNQSDSYYSCYKNGLSGLMMELRQCRAGTVFNKEKSNCVRIAGGALSRLIPNYFSSIVEDEDDIVTV